MNVHRRCFSFVPPPPASVSLLANLPEDKLSKIVDCLEVVSHSVKTRLHFHWRRDKLDPFHCVSSGGGGGVAQPPWQLLGARTLQIAAVKISLPFGQIPLLPVSVFSLPPLSKTWQITPLMNRADTIPVIAQRCILLPELFDQGPRKCLFEKGGRGTCERQPFTVWEPTTLHVLKHVKL